MVIEHFLRMGYYEAAEKLASKTDIRELTNLGKKINLNLFRTHFYIPI